MKKFVLLLAIFVSPCVLFAQELNLIPYPSRVTMLQDNLLIPKNSRFYTDNQKFKDVVNYLNEDLGRAGKKNLTARQKIRISINGANTTPGSYTLNASGKIIQITAADRAGVLYGIITLSQLYKSAQTNSTHIILPGVNIADQPRYQWRGFMLDESRHFFGKKWWKTS